MLDKVLTLPEAAARWGKSETAIRLALTERKRFDEQIKNGLVRKAGKNTWLIHYDAMVQVFGEEKEK
ncbi:helix-turn-helix domain-containing protein [Shimazuella kribbensis]|uniref:helix-turn-helix domain-containing protein n=1 Tax=Shimazuella kribbensis TaxID=139808 RepID=UPI0004049C02|nr:helix-turn-helix domain-containing protein [Shimazuella kribbensis]